ncbi:MAG: hypothetical protein GX492_10750 [Firmicutes bacterium]|nr:hypothetical protein [Bacillota bacterium]
MVKGSQYRTIADKQIRYRIRVNPLRVGLLGKSMAKAEAQGEAAEVRRIVDEELSQQFRLGGHPDYDYLLENVTDEADYEHEREDGVELCIMYVDLRNFSKRALFVDDPGYETIHTIASLKQRAVSTWIKLARYYQGHIHSITGDGLMVLIGGKQEYDSDTWTLGARAFLTALRVLESESMLNEELREHLRQKGLEEYAASSDNLLDIKVAVDFSPSTLMNPQGVVVRLGDERIPVGEVKATSFHVDSCAKLLTYYKDAKERLDGSPKLGRVLLLGEEYKELMAFNDDKVSVFPIGSYKRQMYNVEKSYAGYYIDVKEFKDNILTLSDVAALCNVFDASKGSNGAEDTSLKIARGVRIQHGL